MPHAGPRLVLVPLVLSLLLAAAGTVRAADAARPAWEAGIREGIPAQDLEITRGGAKAVLRRLESKASREPDLVTLYLLARAYGKAGDTASALATYGDVLRQDPGCWFAWRDRGVLRALQKDPAGAEADLRRAVAAKPDYVDALQPLGGLLLEAKRWEEGVRFLQRVLDVEPARESARLQIVEAWLEAGRPDDALRELEPLLARAPRDPGLRLVRARILAAKGDVPAALAVYKQLAVEFPDRPGPLVAWLGVVAQSKSPDPEEILWVLDRLRRLAAGPEEKQRIQVEIDKIRAQMSAGAGVSAGPPGPDAVARQLRDPDPAKRRLGLLYLLQAAQESFVIRGDLLAALVERLDPAREPAPTSRGLALAVFERWGSPEVAPVVRGSLRDPDADVRCKAADALRATGSPYAVAPLARHAAGADLALATSARLAIYGISKTAPPVAADTPQAQAEAFLAWWKGPDGRAAKTRAIEAVVGSADLAPDELIFQFALDEDPEVWVAAYRGLRALVPGTAGSSAPKAAWMRSLPQLDDTALAPGARERFLEAMVSWWERRPS